MDATTEKYEKYLRTRNKYSSRWSYVKVRIILDLGTSAVYTHHKHKTHAITHTSFFADTKLLQEAYWDPLQHRALSILMVGL